MTNDYFWFSDGASEQGFLSYLRSLPEVSCLYIFFLICYGVKYSFPLIY